MTGSSTPGRRLESVSGRYLLKPLDTTKLLAILEKFKKSWIRAEGRWGPWQGSGPQRQSQKSRLEQLYGKLLNGEIVKPSL